MRKRRLWRSDSSSVDPFGRCADFDPLKQVYWGDTHAHTELSFDANMQGTRTTQDDAYAFARGEAIPLQPYDENDAPTRMAQIDRPLDFVMLSDHAEFLGTLVVCNDPESPGYESRQCVDYRAAQEFDADPREVTFIFIEINGLLTFEPRTHVTRALRAGCGHLHRRRHERVERYRRQGGGRLRSHRQLRIHDLSEATNGAVCRSVRTCTAT